MNTTKTQSDHQEPAYTKVLDGRKQPVRGLWARSGLFYAQLSFREADGTLKTRRVPLFKDPEKKTERVQTTAEAIAALRELQVRRTKDDLPVLTKTPTFSECAKRYFDDLELPKADEDREKKPGTIAKEKATVRMWAEHIGGMQVDRINEAAIMDVKRKRQKAGMSKRTINLDFIAFRHVMKYAKREKFIRRLPEVEWLKIKRQKKRDLFTPEQIDALCDAAMEASKNGQEFSDYIRLMCFCGSRRDETLRLRWQDVDWKAKKLTIGADSDTKNSLPRLVNFNEKLEAHLKDMDARRAPDSSYLFPSPQRGEKDIHARTFRETLEAARELAAKKDPALKGIAFHDMRHFFASFAVMSGTDYMTVAEWLGHQDGGILVGKVYGHLADEHKRGAAKALLFDPDAINKRRLAQANAIALPKQQAA